MVILQTKLELIKLLLLVSFDEVGHGKGKLTQGCYVHVIVTILQTLIMSAFFFFVCIILAFTIQRTCIIKSNHVTGLFFF